LKTEALSVESNDLITPFECYRDSSKILSTEEERERKDEKDLAWEGDISGKERRRFFTLLYEE
jgi:hypothetical protein